MIENGLWVLEALIILYKFLLLLCSRKKKKKVLQASLSGQLSYYGQYFVSGYETLRDGGWYKLAVPLSPARLIQKHLAEKRRGTAVGSGDLTRSGGRKKLRDESSKVRKE